MGFSLKWLREFPSALWETFTSNAKENWPEFKAEVAGGAKAVVGGVKAGTESIIKGVLGGFAPTLIIIIVALVLTLILYKKFLK